MITFSATTADDLDEIQAWTDADAYHRGQNNSSWWLTGEGLLAFCLSDDRGKVFYIRIDDGEYARLSIQFAPEDIVCKSRVARTILKVLPKVVNIAKEAGSKGLVFDSESPRLIAFMSRLGFENENGCYKLVFKEFGD